MLRQRAHTKIIALFVVAFICLNAGGAMCVAYCQTFDMSAEAEHCPLKKASEHCDRGQQDPSVAVPGSHDLDCCPMTISFFAAPVEKTSFSVDSAAAIVQPTLAFAPRPVAYVKIFDHAFNYRGPPIDRRMDRLKHCIIRI